LPIEHFRTDKLGYADVVEEISVGEGKVVKITGIRDMGRTATVLVRGSNQLVIDEAERSLHDALCVVRYNLSYVEIIIQCYIHNCFGILVRLMFLFIVSVNLQVYAFCSPNSLYAFGYWGYI
jgi:hypothetical protein